LDDAKKTNDRLSQEVIEIKIEDILFYAFSDSVPFLAIDV